MTALAKSKVQKKDILNIASITTFSRFGLTLYCGYLIVHNDILLSLIILIIAAFTDFLDGWFARKFNCESSFGQKLDPIADKFMLLLVYLFSPVYGTIILVIETIAREISTKLRQKIRSHYIPLGSKYITGFQMTLLGGLILLKSTNQAHLEWILLLSMCYLSYERFSIYKKEYTMYLQQRNKIKPEEQFSTLANKITIFGFILIPIIIWLYLSGEMLWSLVLYIVAWITDLIDGFVAHKYNQKTTFGERLDPIRDKLLIGLVVCLLLPFHYVAVLFVVEIISAIYFNLEKKLTNVHTITKLSRVITFAQGIVLSYTLASSILDFPHLEIGLLIIVLSLIRAGSYSYSYYAQLTKLQTQ